MLHKWTSSLQNQGHYMSGQYAVLVRDYSTCPKGSFCLRFHDSLIAEIWQYNGVQETEEMSTFIIFFAVISQTL